MTKRFCDACGKEIPAYDEYYAEETRAMNVIVAVPRNPSEMIVAKRDLCRECVADRPKEVIARLRQSYKEASEAQLNR